MVRAIGPDGRPVINRDGVPEELEVADFLSYTPKPDLGPITPGEFGISRPVIELPTCPEFRRCAA